jgi:hypothetical protein
MEKSKAKTVATNIQKQNTGNEMKPERRMQSTEKFLWVLEYALKDHQCNIT